MREVRFRLSASKNFMKEKKMCLTHEFLDPLRLSRRFPECFFFFPLFLSLSYSLSLVVVDLDDDDRRRSNNAKDLRIGWSPARSSSYVRVRSSKRRNRERERELKVVSRVVSSSKKKKIFTFSPENVRFFRRVERSRERKRCLFLRDKTKKKERGP